MVVAFVEVLSNPSTSVFKWPTTAGDWKKRGHTAVEEEDLEENEE